MEWFRFYDEVLDDPKVQRLPAALFRDWVNILCLCNRNDPRGVLPSIDDVAFGLRCSSTKAKTTVKKLHEAELLVTSDGVTYPNGWHKRQRVSDDVARRVAKHRARNVTGNDTGNVTGNTADTLPHARATDTETDTETELTTASAVVEGANAPATPEKPKPKTKRATQVPDDFAVTEQLEAWGASQDPPFSPEAMRVEVPQFVDYYRGKGEARKDWVASFRTWMRNSRKFSGNARAAPTKPDGKITSVDQLFAEGVDDESTGYPENSHDFESRVASEWPGQSGDTSVDTRASGTGFRAIAGGRR